MKVILSESELRYLFKDVEILKGFINSISEGCRAIGSEVDINLDSDYKERATKRLKLIEALVKESEAYKKRTTFENAASMGSRDVMLKLAKHEVETYVLGSRGSGKSYFERKVDEHLQHRDNQTKR